MRYDVLRLCVDDGTVEVVFNSVTARQSAVMQMKEMDRMIRVGEHRTHTLVTSESGHYQNGDKWVVPERT